MQRLMNRAAASSAWQALDRRLPLRRLVTPLRFGLVGVSGLLLNTALLWLLTLRVGLQITLASALASEAAIVSNFLLNDRWTFRNTSQHPAWRRFVQFNGVALGGLAITAGLLTGLTLWLHMPLLLANLIGVGCATVWNYIVNTRWTWRARAAQRPTGG